MVAVCTSRLFDLTEQNNYLTVPSRLVLRQFTTMFKRYLEYRSRPWTIWEAMAASFAITLFEIEIAFFTHPTCLFLIMRFAIIVITLIAVTVVIINSGYPPQSVCLFQSSLFALLFTHLVLSIILHHPSNITAILGILVYGYIVWSFVTVSHYTDTWFTELDD